MPRLSNGMNEYEPQPNDRCWICKRTLSELQKYFEVDYTRALLRRYYARIRHHPLNKNPSVQLSEEKELKPILPPNTIDMTSCDFETKSEKPIFICAFCYELIHLVKYNEPLRHL